MSHNPHNWSDGIPDCIIFASTADAERGAAMYRSMADALDAQAERIKALEGALRGGADLIDGDLVGPEWRAACRKFTTEARALLGEK